MIEEKIPVTILTGFLGSGKTTLLNRLMQENPGKKFAVIENEFGQHGIDASLIENSCEGLYELSNGCICCSLNEELGKTLNQLLLSDLKIDHLLIETTGIADPAAIARTILFDLHFQTRFQLDSIVALADAPHIEKMLEQEEVLARQLACSHIILLNKQDSVDKEHLERTKEILQEFNPEAEVVPTSYAQCEKNLLELKACELQEQTKRFEQIKADKSHSNMRSCTIRLSEALDSEKLHFWLQMILVLQPGLYRVKGLLNILGQERQIVLQSVCDQFNAVAGKKWEETPESILLFIGRDLDKKALEEGLRSCISD